jgi:predicted esterase
MFDVEIIGNSKKSAVVALAARGMSAITIALEYMDVGLTDTTIIGISPKTEWYPAPKSPSDQKDAVLGINLAIVKVNKAVDEALIQAGNISRSKTALVGLSAGGCLALEMGAYYSDFAGVVCHSGCIYDSNAFIPAINEIPILLTHSKKDTVFDWNQRYIPTKNALKRQGYNLSVMEKEVGGHCLSMMDRIAAGQFLSPLLGYTDWKFTDEKSQMIAKAAIKSV